jgi:ubiquinone/menaquinone biosynthesis C-methylase UbiE
MTSPVSALEFYDRHPISEGQVLDALARQGKAAEALAPEDLYAWDQDHYGGIEAVALLARGARVAPGSLVLDVCGGLGGPARFLASRFGAVVTVLDLNAGRCLGARRLTRLVGLSDLVRVVRGDAQGLPFRAGSFAAVVSQEGLLHVRDKTRVILECRRVLRAGGRIAFTDWVATGRLADGERRRLEQWMAAVTIQSVPGYRDLLRRAAFAHVEVEDLSVEWVRILRERHRMYRSLRADTAARLGQARYDEYDQLYGFFVGLVQARKLGGARFSGTAAPACA